MALSAGAKRRPLSTPPSTQSSCARFACRTMGLPRIYSRTRHTVAILPQCWRVEPSHWSAAGRLRSSSFHTGRSKQTYQSFTNEQRTKEPQMLFLIELNHVRQGTVPTRETSRAFIEHIIFPTLARAE